MLLENTGNHNTFGGDKFTVETSASIFNIMSSSLYTNPELAAARELLSNAIDATKEAGTTKKCRMVLSDKGITVVDFGAGMSPKVIKSVYSSLFSTTKSNSNDSTGGFGVGALSAFAIADSFTVETRTNVEDHGRQYYVSKDHSGIPTITLLDEGVEMEVGTKVTVLKNPFYMGSTDKETLRLISFLNEDVCEVKLYMDEGSKFNVSTTGLPGLTKIGYVGLVWPLGEIDGNRAYLTGNTVQDVVYNLLGAIRFERVRPSTTGGQSHFVSRVSQGSNIYSLSSLLMDCPSGLLVEAKVGTFTMSPAREELRNTPENKAAAVRIIQSVLDHLRRGFGSLTKYKSSSSSERMARWLIGDTPSVLPYSLYNGRGIAVDWFGNNASFKYSRKMTSPRYNVVEVAFVPPSVPMKDVRFTGTQAAQIIVKAAKSRMTEENKAGFLSAIDESMDGSFMDCLVVEGGWYDVDKAGRSRPASRKLYQYWGGSEHRTYKKADVYLIKEHSKYPLEGLVSTVGAKNFPCNGFDEYRPIYRTAAWAEKHDPDGLQDASTFVASLLNSDKALYDLAVEKVSTTMLFVLKRYIKFGPAVSGIDMTQVKGVGSLVTEALEKAVEKLAQELQDEDTAREIFSGNETYPAIFGKDHAVKMARMVDLEALKDTFSELKGIK